MKYSELKQIAQMERYDVTEDKNDIELSSYAGANIIRINKSRPYGIFINNTFCKESDWNMLQASVELAGTLIPDREEEKRYIVPLPHLTLSDGEQIYLTYQGNFFPFIRDKALKQTWKGKDLVHIPQEYRRFAVEMEAKE